MTYEEIVEELQHVIEREQDKEYDADTFNLGTMAQDCLRFIAEQHNPSLDENGLVPCGCGGKAEIVKTYDENSWTNIVHVACKKCKIHITFTAPAELSGTDALKEDAKAAWNRAMGYKGADK